MGGGEGDGSGDGSGDDDDDWWAGGLVKKSMLTDEREDRGDELEDWWAGGLVKKSILTDELEELGTFIRTRRFGRSDILILTTHKKNGPMKQKKIPCNVLNWQPNLN